jgi:hypothetical protein
MSLYEFPIIGDPRLIRSGMSRGCHEIHAQENAQQHPEVPWQSGCNFVGARATGGPALLISLPEPHIKEWEIYRGTTCMVRLANRLLSGRWEGQFAGSGDMCIILRDLKQLSEEAIATLPGTVQRAYRCYLRVANLSTKYQRLAARQGKSRRNKAANKARHYANQARDALRQLAFKAGEATAP